MIKTWLIFNASKHLCQGVRYIGEAQHKTKLKAVRKLRFKIMGDKWCCQLTLDLCKDQCISGQGNSTSPPEFQSQQSQRTSWKTCKHIEEWVSRAPYQNEEYSTPAKKISSSVSTTPANAGANLVDHGTIFHVRVTALHNGRGQDDRDSVVQDWLTEHQHVQDWVNIQGLKEFLSKAKRGWVVTWNIARVATGSTALMSEPKAKLWTNVRG